jgi:Protein of unknown function (DUF1566)/Repeat of unknown function (DUF5648)
MSFSTKKITAYCGGIALIMLTACSGQSGTDTLANGGASNQTNQTLSFSASSKTGSTQLLDSLAVLYPNGQLPANRTIQAGQDLSQNPAALKLTAAKSQSAANPTNTTVTVQAVAADYQPVKRIQNTTLYGAYFFSIYPTEITTALATNPNWSLEGPAFWASLATGTDLYPVHRFRNKTNGSYLYSIYETERADIATNYAATFEYEGVAWYARQTPATGWSALYRFRNKTNGTYLFSAYESEKNAIVATYPDVFALEGIAYYVRQDAPASCTAATTGSTGYSLVFKGCSTANVAEYYDKTECVRDNASGLIWQGQTAAGTGLRANDEYKTNYDSITEKQKWKGTYSGPGGALDITNDFIAPTATEVNATTNSIGFKNAINASNLCGSGAWRMPTKDELLGIVKPTELPTIDSIWFPNTVNMVYWTSSAYVGYAFVSWYVHFDDGNTNADYRDGNHGYDAFLVRLVR